MALLPRSYTGTGGILGSAVPDEYAALKDAFGGDASVYGGLPQERPWIRPGSFLDGLINGNGGPMEANFPDVPGGLSFKFDPAPLNRAREPGGFLHNLFQAGGAQSGHITQPLMDVLTQPPKADPYAALTDAFGGDASVYSPQQGGQPAAQSAPQAAPSAPSASQVFAQPDAWTMQQQRPQKTIDELAYGSPGAAVPPNAQPAQAPIPQRVQSPDLLTRLSAASSNMANTPGLLTGLFSALQGMQTGLKTSETDQFKFMQAARQAFIDQGMAPAQATSMAQVVAMNPKIAEKLFEPPANIEAAIARQMGNGGQTGGDPFDALRRLEQAKATGSKAGGVIGDSQATAQIDLPTALSQAKETLRLTSELRRHPGRNQIGWHDVLGSAPLIPSTKGYDAQKLLDQIKGGAFLTAFKTLSGGGPITDIEGKKATDAIARMDRATSREEFDKALSDFEGVVRLGVDRASQKAGQAAPFNFKGNSAWQEVRPGVRMRQVQ